MTRQNIILVILSILLIVGILSLVGLYDSGYRFSGFKLLRPATIALAGIPQDAVVTIDGKEVELPRDAEGVASFRASASSHDVIVTREGYWPWEKEVLPPSDGLMTLNPFLFPRETKASVIPQGDAVRRTAVSRIAAQKVPSAGSPLLSPDGSVLLFVRKDDLVASVPDGKTPPAYFCRADGCDSERVILALQNAEMRDVAFLPSRSDIALIATQNAVFALEIDSRGIQNFQPIYKGTRPRFTILDGALYIEDGSLVFTVSLE